jgi:hypothetical protein
VDLDQVLSQEHHVAMAPPVIPAPPQARPALTATVLGLKAISLTDPSNTPKQTIQEMYQAGEAKAQADLLGRLRELNRDAVQEFRLQQESSISGDEAKAFADANEKIRPLFDKWAGERAAVFSDLAMIEGFPLPIGVQPAADKLQTTVSNKLAEKANALRDKLKALDGKFKEDSDSILAAVAKKTHVNKTDLGSKIAQLTADLDSKAKAEAKAQIRKAESRLSFQLADTAPIRLPQSPARQLTIPAEKALDAAPKVPSGGILDATADRRRWLEHELRIWLALNRYTLSSTRSGHRDATQEFQTWRQLNGAGP